MGKDWSVPFKDNIHIAYIDSSQADDTPLGKLMHDFRCRHAEDMYYPLLKEKVHYYKESEKGVTTMSDLMEKFMKEERAEVEGNIILNMLKGHEQLKKIITFTGWSADQIRALAEKNGLAVE